MMSKGFEKLLSKKKDKESEMSDNEKDAKMGVVSAMRDMASKAMSDKLGGLKKVSVASDSPEGLKEGLDKAKELLSGHMTEEAEEGDDRGDNLFAGGSGEHDEGDDADGQESTEHEASGSPDFEAGEHMSEDELDAKLAHLMALKSKMQASK